uniref:Ion_trans domain-containing protein n=1 Tax=Wuchereria bancrofti TaxID=6293 RepID=A0A1I8ELT1_WUCBA
MIYRMLKHVNGVCVREGWPSIRQNSMDTTEEDEGLLPFYRVEMALFYIMFFIVFPFFLNIFVALIIITFQEQGEAELSEGDLDKNQVSQMFCSLINLISHNLKFLGK